MDVMNVFKYYILKYFEFLKSLFSKYKYGNSLKQVEIHVVT